MAKPPSSSTPGCPPSFPTDALVPGERGGGHWGVPPRSPCWTTALVPQLRGACGDSALSRREHLARVTALPNRSSRPVTGQREEVGVDGGEISLLWGLIRLRGLSTADWLLRPFLLGALPPHSCSDSMASKLPVRVSI